MAAGQVSNYYLVRRTAIVENDRETVMTSGRRVIDVFPYYADEP